MDGPESLSATGNYLRRNAAVALAVGAAVFGGVEATQVLAAPNEAAARSAINRDPIFEHFDADVIAEVKEMKFLIANDVKGTYQEDVTLADGEKLTRLVVAVSNAGLKTYTLVSAYVKKGQNMPTTIATIFDSPRARFIMGNLENEPFNRARIWVPNPGNKNDYLLADISRDPAGGWNNRYYEKIGSKNITWLNKSKNEKLSEQKMAAQFKSFTNQQDYILKHAGHTMPRP